MTLPNYRDHGSYQIIERPLKSVFRITNTPRYQIFRYRTPEVKAMSVIDCDYLPADKVVFPPELALLIVRKAAAMAEAFESQALDQLTKDARRALLQGSEPRRIIREMRL